MKASSLKSMTVEALIETRKQIDKLLSSKVATARKELSEKLSYLDGLFGGRGRGRGPGRPKGSKRTVAAKYRGPNGETWAGRGMRPRWLTALVNEGRSVEEFAVSGAGTARKKPAKKKGAGRKRGRPPGRKKAA